MTINLRHATEADLDRIMEVYAIARQFMRDHDNPNQWQNNHPAREIVEADIKQQRNYVVEADGQVEGVFFFSTEKDPTYAYIEGEWLAPDAPYGVIHRIASSGKVRGILSLAVQYGLQHTEHLRIDTHADNYVMQNAILKNGFTRCGIIYLENGDPRIAYERI